MNKTIIPAYHGEPQDHLSYTMTEPVWMYEIQVNEQMFVFDKPVVLAAADRIVVKTIDEEDVVVEVRHSYTATRTGDEG